MQDGKKLKKKTKQEEAIARSEEAKAKEKTKQEELIMKRKKYEFEILKLQIELKKKCLIKCLEYIISFIRRRNLNRHIFKKI
jgi:hypothetical protein